MKNYKELNLNFPVLRDDFAFPKQMVSSHSTFRVDVETSVHADLINFFKSVGLKDIRALIFRTPPNTKSSIHVDGASLHEQWAINWAWGGDHLMRWWNPISPVIKSQNIRYTNANTPYLFWTDNEVTLAEQVKLIKPAIIKIGVPHSVENFSSTNRWCLSIRSNIPSTWNTGLDIFKDFLL